MSRIEHEVLYEGWLTKSPPTKRYWRGRWRRRWFTLHSGEMPEQFVLSYYTDRHTKKLKGSIDLEQCNQVDIGIRYQDKKFRFDHMFDIITPTRTYFLAADTDVELQTWVKYICHVCCLKPTFEEERDDMAAQVTALRPSSLPASKSSVGSPPVSPTTPVSTDPYIMISECVTGKVPVSPNQSVKDTILNQNLNLNNGRLAYASLPPTYLNFDPKFYDIPRNQQPPSLAGQREEPSYCNFYVKNSNASPLQSPTDTDSVFTDDDWAHNTHSEHSNKLNPRPSNSSSVDVEVPSKKIHRLSIEDGAAAELVAPPPRPPKSSHIASINYHQNNETVSSTSLSKSSPPVPQDAHAQLMVIDEMYDFPRSHNIDDIQGTLSRRHCYNNAAPSELNGQIFTYDNPSPKPGTSNAQVFQYGDEILDEPASPASQSSSTAQYSNLPSPLLPDTQLMPPPKVNRGLKPKRKLSDSVSIASSTEPHSPHYAPSVDRKLKPPGTLPMPTRKAFEDGTGRRFRGAPSPIQPSLGRSFESSLADNENEQVYVTYSPLANQRKILEYLDLDLDSKAAGGGPRLSTSSATEPLRSPDVSTVYKEVDFMKTKAFNMTKDNRERTKQDTAALKK